jgi:hypothetical protein
MTFQQPWLTRLSDSDKKQRAWVYDTARKAAEKLALTQQYVTADDVQSALLAAGMQPSALGNSAGSIFRGIKTLKQVPQATVRSRRIARHGSAIRIYESTEYGGLRMLLQDFIKGYNA